MIGDREAAAEQEASASHALPAPLPKLATISALLQTRCRRYGLGRSVERSGRPGSHIRCRPVTVWLSNDVPACRVLAVAWLIRGATLTDPE